MRSVLKWTGIVIGSLVMLLILAGTGLYTVGTVRLNTLYSVQTAAIEISSEPDVLARGAHLTKIFGCTDCHGDNLAGKIMIDEPPFRVTASNLTSGSNGVAGSYSVEDFDRAIRHGVRPNGKALVVMPSSVYNEMSDDDAAAIISYLKSLQPVDSDLSPTQVRLIGRMLAAGPIDPSFEVRTAAARSTPAPERGPTPEYGRYLAAVTCAHCHGGDLRGNEKPPAPGSPPAPDLAIAGQWPIELFSRAVTAGQLPGNRTMNPDFMPFVAFQHMEEYEVQAIHSYLASLHP
jgi:mono/diheme cytochrome c family protein